MPPASVPLSLFAAAAVGLVGLGVAGVFAADDVARSPLMPGTIATVHLAMLAFLSVGVVGALHQFAPVIGRGPLRSVPAARVSGLGLAVTAWLLPTGFAHGPSELVPAAGVLGLVSVSVIAWNLSGPLGAGAAGVPVWGLRLSVGALVVTVIFGAVYAFDREAGWFPLLGHRVLAHAHLGLLGWLGLTYVAVAEKLWPMFLLAHRRSDRLGRVAVAALASGVAVGVFGLVLAWSPVAWFGGAVVAVGLGAHLASLVSLIRHRRRRLELLHVFIMISAGFLVAAVALALVAAVAVGAETATRQRLVSAEVVALTAWLGLAVLGHVHKIVPFIGYQRLRAEGIATGPAGGPLLFSDLVARTPARCSLVGAAAGAFLLLVGVLSSAAVMIAAGAGMWALTGGLTAANLAIGPRRVRRAAASVPAVAAAPEAPEASM
ncbi:MAG: hypothetical protein ACK5OX_10660 [Desertimonas sp.]